MNIGIYLRVSNEDDSQSDSTSILGQRNLIRNYILSNFDNCGNNSIEYIDDGYTGTNFDRPGMKKMLEDIKSGLVDCVIVKDLSRFGRNYLEVGNYIERVFPFLNVRFISINDCYDSLSHHGRTSDIDIPFKNLLYDLYSKDISRKILSSKRNKIEKGEFYSKDGFYGYKKDPFDRNKLIIDEPAAQIIKLIYEECIKGKSTGQIAEILNDNNVPTPVVHKANRGVKHNLKTALDNPFWKRKTIRTILDDERYTGKYIANKVHIRIADGKKTKKVPKEEWVILDGKIPQIVTQDHFELVQEKKVVRERTYKYSNEVPVIFKQKVKCSCCGCYLERKGDNNKKRFKCAKSYYKSTECYNGLIYENDLTDMLLELFNNHINKSLDSEAKRKIYNESKTLEKKLLLDKLVTVETAIKAGSNSDIVLYEKYKNCEMTKDEYLTKKKATELEKAENLEYKGNIELDLKKFEEKYCGENTGIETKIENLMMIEKIDREIVDLLVEEILVLSNGELEVKLTYTSCSK